MSVELIADELGDGPPLVILHGLLGSARNWRSVAVALARGRRVIAADLRNHGRSPRAPSMRYEDMAADVRALIERRCQPHAAVLGHSMGGKVAMTLALSAPEHVERLVVVDIGPCAHPDTITPFIAALRGLGLAGLGSRADADRALATAIPDATLRGFLLQNLRRAADGWSWRADLAAIQANLSALTGFPELPAGVRYEGPVLLVRGALSPLVGAREVAALRARFPRARVETIERAGHWPHVQRPQAFLEVLRDFL